MEAKILGVARNPDALTDALDATDGGGSCGMYCGRECDDELELELASGPCCWCASGSPAYRSAIGSGRLDDELLAWTGVGAWIVDDPSYGCGRLELGVEIGRP